MTRTEALDAFPGALDPAGPSPTPPRPRRAAHRRPRTLRATPAAVSWAVAVLGLALRLREYLSNPSLWNDEAELGLNIVNRSYAGLTHPLASNQGAPIGFLFLEKTAVEIFGPAGFALRLAPFLAAVILVVVFRSLAMRTLGGWAGCVAVLLVAVSPSLVYYSTDAKQYSGDAMAVVVLAWVTIRAVERHLSTGSLLVWGTAAAVLVWFSFPAAFAAGTGAVVLLITARRDGSALLRTAGATALWLVSFGLEYLVSLRDLHDNDVLLTFWSYALAPTNGSKAAWLYDVVVGVLHDPLGLILLPVAAVMLCVGGVALVLHRLPIGVFCIVLVAATLVGGLVRQYPVADRMVLFLVPFAALMLAGTLLLSARFGLLAVPLVVLVAATTFSSASVASGPSVHHVERPHGPPVRHRPCRTARPGADRGGGDRGLRLLPPGRGLERGRQRVPDPEHSRGAHLLTDTRDRVVDPVPPGLDRVRRRRDVRAAIGAPPVPEGTRGRGRHPSRAELPRQQ